MKIAKRVFILLNFVEMTLSQPSWTRIRWNGREFETHDQQQVQTTTENDAEHREALQQLRNRIQQLLSRFDDRTSNQDSLTMNQNPLLDRNDFFYNRPSSWRYHRQPTPPPIRSQSRLCDQPANEGMTTDGIFTIEVNGVSMDIYCEIGSSSGNWLVFQRRLDGSVDFYRNWKDYKNGFGQKSGEFWLGLSNLHEITRYGSYALRVDLEDFNGNTAYAEYSMFSIGSPADFFPMFVRGYSGNAGDSLSYHNGFPFSTKDRDNDSHYRKRSCAVDGHGAWWYNSCQHSNLNGRYITDGRNSIQSMVWYHWKFDLSSMRRTTMKIQPNN